MNIPQLHGNWVDLIILMIMLFYFFEGWNRGFLLGFLDLTGFILSFVVSLKFYSFLGELLVTNFSLPGGIAKALGFLMAGLLAEMVFSILAHLIIVKFYQTFREKIKERENKKYLNFLEKFFGFIPAMGESLVFVAFILTLIIALPVKGTVKKDVLQSKIGGPLIAQTQGIERQIKSVFGQAINESLTFLTINSNPESSESVNLGFSQKEVKVDEGAEQTMINLVNEERIKAGFKALSYSEALQIVARDMARDMFGRGYFSHTSSEGLSPFDRMKKNGIEFLAGGENLALAPNVVLAHQGLMNSSGHRANILSEDCGIYGEIFVQEFTD